MKRGFGSYLFGAVIALLAGGAALAVSSYETHAAAVYEHAATGDYDRAAAAIDAAAPYVEAARWVPWIGRGPSDRLRAQAAALQYWQREYDALAGSNGAGAPVDPDNVDLQLIAANAGFRQRQPGMTERMAAIRALDEAIAVYFEVLKHASWREDAAYNYEYLSRLRDELARGRRRLPPQLTDDALGDAAGAAGVPAEAAEEGNFEIYIPLEREEREEGDAGKSEARPRRG